MLKHRIEPVVLEPFTPEVFKDISTHVKEVRRLYDWPGIPYHDKDAPKEHLFNRWFWHNLPLLKAIHNSPEFVKKASEIFGQNVMPSYCFLSMYGPEGVCPVHTDRPQCQFTIDLQIHSDGKWPIYVDEKSYELENGHALAYSGTGQVHYRKPMSEDGKGCSFMDLAFFHFCPVEWMGVLS